MSLSMLIESEGVKTPYISSMICLVLQVSEKVDGLSIGRANMTNIILYGYDTGNRKYLKDKYLTYTCI